MKNMISELTIKNFKSIKDITLSCKQVNIFVGKPNTGKSNILEAISLLSGNVIFNKKFLDGALYYENINDLFNMRDYAQPIYVKGDGSTAQLSYYPTDRMFGYFADNKATNALSNVLGYSTALDALNNFVQEKKFAEDLVGVDAFNAGIRNLQTGQEFNGKTPANSYFGALINRDGAVSYSTGTSRLSPIRSYHYKRQSQHGNPEIGYLLPPHGDNLLEVLRHTPALQEVMHDFFEPFGFDIVLVLDSNDGVNSIRIQKKYGTFHVQLPYSLVADTLQRMIFHLGAMYSNSDAVILFEEPEAHTYVPYQSYLAGEIIEDEQNQYFITTHSDQILDSLLRPNPEKVAVFIVDYYDSQTIVRPLSEEEVSDLLNSYASIFQNLDGYAVQ